MRCRRLSTRCIAPSRRPAPSPRSRFRPRRLRSVRTGHGWQRRARRSRVWSTKTGRRLLDLGRGAGPFNDVAFSCRRSGAWRPAAARAWRRSGIARNGRRLASLESPVGGTGIYALAFDPEGKRIAADDGVGEPVALGRPQAAASSGRSEPSIRCAGCPGARTEARRNRGLRNTLRRFGRRGSGMRDRQARVRQPGPERCDP